MHKLSVIVENWYRDDYRNDNFSHGLYSCRELQLYYAVLCCTVPFYSIFIYLNSMCLNKWILYPKSRFFHPLKIHLKWTNKSEKDNNKITHINWFHESYTLNWNYVAAQVEPDIFPRQKIRCGGVCKEKGRIWMNMSASLPVSWIVRVHVASNGPHKHTI